MLELIMSLLPIICLLTCLLVLNMTAIKASAWSFLSAAAIYFFYFKSGSDIMISMAKGFGLAIFVVLIIWGAMLLYNVVNETGALKVINRNIEMAIEDRLIQFLLLSWVFASFLQGIAGFGVPVIVVTPILVALGFAPEISAAAVLVGHCWSISFGSMGSSIYAINMVTETDLEEIVLNMSLFGTVAMVCTGIAVCFIFGRKGSFLKGLVYVFIT
ncbi:MAG: L-lactate permease, partial [Anaerovoracaceae bacterium]